MVYFLQVLYAVWARELKRSLRESGQLMGAFSRPLLWVLIFGVGLSPFFRTGLRETSFLVPFTYVQFIFPAVVVLNIIYPAVQSAISLIYDRELGFFREVFASPAPRPAVFLGKLLGGASLALLQGMLVLLLAPFVDVPVPWGVFWACLLPMLLIALAFTALGLVIASRMTSFEGFGVFANTLILPVYFLASSVFPLDPSLTIEQQQQIFPPWLVFLVRINPLTYAIDTLRGVSIGFQQFDPIAGWLVLSLGTALLVGWAYYEFNRR
ncbi:ABC transporter permease [Meiothermus ruber]|uniref:ABC transporter permease n=1 Tax=Meiothermus ruber TaxID=277 RepID=UPI00034ACC60|nr:ABC transporter permease [Meiothermus ruber]MCX7783881.1 ABC transporter permease [Meiothermus sp.]GAO75241.1 ABC-2 type transporter [Meiothermus ruber H328]